MAFLGGASGSGKTSLLKLISGLINPHQGKILPKNIDLAFISQNPDDQFFATTPREGISWGLEQRGIHKNVANQKAMFWLKKMGLEKLADESLAKLSFGEKKRVAFAGALSIEPQLLLCDEPTAGLDFLAAKRLIATLEDVSKEHPLSVIWVSHDLFLLPKSAKKSLLIRDGAQVFYGPTQNALLNDNLTLAGLR